jgi:DNA mismatch repair protein MSH2
VRSHPSLQDGSDKQEHIQSLDPYTQLVEDTIELADIHHGRTVLKATLDGDLEALQQDLVRVRDLLDDEHDRVARDLGVEKNKKLHLENHQVYHYSLRITKAVSFSPLLPCFIAPTFW